MYSWVGSIIRFNLIVMHLSHGAIFESELTFIVTLKRFQLDYYNWVAMGLKLNISDLVHSCV